MRVLFIVNSLRTGGAERHLLELIRNGAVRQQFIPHVVCLKQPGELADELLACGIPTEALGMRSGYDPRGVAGVLRLAGRRPPDLVYSHSNKNEMFVAHVAQTLFRVPRVCVVHSTPLRTAGERFSPLQRALMRRASVVIGMAAVHRRQLVETEGMDGARTVYIHTGIDEKRFHPRVGSESTTFPELACRRVIGMVGTLTRDKGHHLLLDAMPRILETHPDAALVFVGEGPSEPRLRTQIADLRLEQHVVLLGRRAEVSSILRKMDIFVLPSLRETFSVATLEAMATGLPVVVTTVGSMAEMVEDGRTGFLIEPNSVTALADRIAAVLADESVARTVGRAARERVEQAFTLDTMVGAYAQLMRQLAGLERASVDMTPA